MFDTFGKANETAGRKENTLRKLARLNLEKAEYARQLLEKIPGVEAVSPFTWFGGKYKNEEGMSFAQFAMLPYIGDGSPVDQYFWVDDMVVATARP